MSALIYIILALGYLHALEGKEQLSLTDFLLDFLLSLWVPTDYVPSKVVRGIVDPAVREQMISVEKSRTALDNYIQHLLRYARENTGTDGSQAVMGDLASDSSQLYSTNLPYGCNQQTYGCEYAGSGTGQQYANSDMFAGQQNAYAPPMTSNQQALPVQTVYTNPSPLGNPGFIPNQGALYPQDIHYPHFHGNEYIPMHVHQPHDYDHLHNNYQPQLDEIKPVLNNDDADSFEWGTGNIPDSIASLFPDIVGKTTNLFSDLMEDGEDEPECDPGINQGFYNPTYCTPAVGEPYFYRGVKRNIPNYNDNRKRLISGLQSTPYPEWIKNPMTTLAKKILYLVTEKPSQGGITGTRMLAVSVPKQEIEGEVSPNPNVIANSIGDSNEKQKRHDSDASDPVKAVETKIFEDWYIPNYFNDVLKHSYALPIEAGPNIGIAGYESPYYNDPFVGNRLISKKFHPQGKLSSSLKQRLRPETIPIWRSLVAPISTESTIAAQKNESSKESLLKRSLLPTEKKKLHEKPVVAKA